MGVKAGLKKLESLGYDDEFAWSCVH